MINYTVEAKLIEFSEANDKLAILQNEVSEAYKLAVSARFRVEPMKILIKFRK